MTLRAGESIPPKPYTPAEVAARGVELYERRLRALLEPTHRDEMLTIDIVSGDYELAGSDDIAAARRLRTRHPDGVFFGLRIGHAATYDIGYAE